MTNFDSEVLGSDVSADNPLGRRGEISTKPAVLILGMHRSGTSSLAGTLIWLGGAAPVHLMPPTEDNERGHWESTVLAALNDEILAASGSEWRDWRQFDSARIDPAAAAAFSARAMTALAAEFGDATLPVVKDPRMCRLMPFWSTVFGQVEWSVRAILLLRSPLEVARSLNRRDGIPLSSGCLLWLRHVLDAEAETRETRRAILHWDEFLGDRRRALAQLGERLALTWPRWSEAALEQVDVFVSPDLKRQKADDEDLKVHPVVSDLVRETYAVMIALVDDPSDARLLHKLDDCRARFNDSAAIFDRAMFEVEEEAWRMFEVDARRGYETLIGTTKEEFSSQIAAERNDFAHRLSAAKEEFARQIAAERSDFANRLAAERSDFANRLNAATEEFTSRIAAERSYFANQLNAAKGGFTSQIDTARKDAWRMVAYMADRYARKGRGVRVRDYWRTSWRVRKQLKIIRNSAFFDEEYYLDSNPDVRTVGMDAALHYLLHGAQEGRNPGPYFSTSQYLARNRDVSAASVNPIVHYETCGRGEHPPSRLE